MKTKVVIGLIVLVVIIGFAIFILPRGQNQPPTPVVTISDTELPSPTATSAVTLEIFNQPVTVKLLGATEATSAADKQEITEGTTVVTGDTGRAQLVFPNKSVTRLDFNTEIILKKFTASPQQVEIKLNKKRIWNRVAKLLGQESFQSETATTLATVRGTSYAHGILPDGRNRVISTKGVVESKCVDESQEATVTPNAKILFDCKGGGKLPLLGLDEQVKDRDEWFDFNQKKDQELDERFGKETYGDEGEK